MKKARVKEIRGEEWKIEGNLVIKEGKIYVPKDGELRAEIIQLHHDVPVAGHGGRWKTVELVARGNKRCREICRGMRFVSENEE